MLRSLQGGKSTLGAVFPVRFFAGSCKVGAAITSGREGLVPQAVICQRWGLRSYRRALPVQAPLCRC